MAKGETLDSHIQKVRDGERRFENVYESISRMILEDDIEKVNVHGKNVHDFKIFRKGHKPIVGMYDEINSFVSFVKDAAEGGMSKEMAFVLVGEPGNGKTFFVERLCDLYRQFIAQPENRRYTFKFSGLKNIVEADEDDEWDNDSEAVSKYGGIRQIESQTFEDPMVLAMNLKETRSDSLEFLGKTYGLSDEQLKRLEKQHRPLGACSDYIFNDILEHTGSVEEALKHVKVIPVPMSESLGTVTGKYSARDKITSSSKDLLGEESVQRLLHIRDTHNPYRLDLRTGALARVGGGGIHFADELYKNKKDLVQIYLGAIQDRQIEFDGFKWPLDTLVIATSNNEEFNKFISEREEAPIIDRCNICYMKHNTDYKIQQQLTDYAIGSEIKTTLMGENLHIDPNLNYAASIAATLSRLPHSEKLTPVETMQLAAGEVAGEKSINTLAEVIDNLNQNPDVTKRFGQRGLGHRDLGRAMKQLLENSETQEEGCMFAKDIFGAFERVILDNETDEGYRNKFFSDLETARGLYKERIMTQMFDAYMDEPEAIEKDVMNYVNMVIGLEADNVGPDKIFKYRDQQTGEVRPLKIDTKYVNSVEEKLGLKTEEEKQSFRSNIRKIWGARIPTDPSYNFMDNKDLVKAVTEVRLKSDVAGAASLVGALTNRWNEENLQLYNRMINTMKEKLGYCDSCAERTIKYYTEYEDVS